jgi:2-hydroxychromene-2-carboxylate isomerase
MSRVEDYYLIPVAPYSYPGGERITKIANDHDTTVNVLPIDLTCDSSGITASLHCHGMIFSIHIVNSTYCRCGALDG